VLNQEEGKGGSRQVQRGIGKGENTDWGAATEEYRPCRSLRLANSLPLKAQKQKKPQRRTRKMLQRGRRGELRCEHRVAEGYPSPKRGLATCGNEKLSKGRRQKKKQRKNCSKLRPSVLRPYLEGIRSPGDKKEKTEKKVRGSMMGNGRLNTAVLILSPTGLIAWGARRTKRYRGNDEKGRKY